MSGCSFDYGSLDDGVFAGPFFSSIEVSGCRLGGDVDRWAFRGLSGVGSIVLRGLEVRGEIEAGAFRGGQTGE